VYGSGILRRPTSTRMTSFRRFSRRAWRQTSSSPVATSFIRRETPICNLFATMLEHAGVRPEHVGDSTGLPAGALVELIDNAAEFPSAGPSQSGLSTSRRWTGLTQALALGMLYGPAAEARVARRVSVCHRLRVAGGDSTAILSAGFFTPGPLRNANQVLSDRVRGDRPASLPNPAMVRSAVEGKYETIDSARCMIRRWPEAVIRNGVHLQRGGQRSF